MTPPLIKTPPQEEETKVPVALESFRVIGVNTAKLLKRIEEEGEEVWLDEYNAH